MKERRNLTGVALASILTLLTLPPFLAREPDNRLDPPDVSPRVRTPLIRVEEVSELSANPATFALPLPPAVGDAWIHLGPGPLLNGQVENISPDGEVIGAIHTVAAHPTDPDILLLGAVNGGIWRTTNASDPSPDWTPLIDFSPTLSIGALEFDPTDSTHQTLVGGVGLFSSFGRVGGARTGLLRTTNGGDNWTQITGGGILNGKNISGVAARGNTIVISVNIADSFTFGNVGIFRSTNGGATFTQISVGDGTATGLPGGVANDLAGDPASSGTLYTSIIFAPIVGGLNGIYRSTDTGATWTKVSNAAMDLLILNNATNNLEMSAGASGQVYAGIINDGQLAGLFRSGNGGATWVEMDLPVTNEDGVDIGLQPSVKPGGQGSIHFSILADPGDANIVYLGGDRQPRAFGDTGGFPNSIGANDFSGRLFRCDASQAAGSQC
ncbi:MAG: hypothetical protein O6947_07885, partial [Acidobacteria bacterium]|nr:hypothetical protein [Acidobacteriota bacterium]